jgi:ASTRA-associated protein 1
MSAPPAPSPKRILRVHSAQVNVVRFSPLDLEGKVNQRLYSGDADGRVVVTSTSTNRTLASWGAHSAGVLSIEEWDQFLMTYGGFFISCACLPRRAHASHRHGRDNKLHFWERVVAGPSLTEAVSPLEDVAPPTLKFSMDVNALNFCPLSLMRQRESSLALIALPNLVDGALVSDPVPTSLILCLISTER